MEAAKLKRESSDLHQQASLKFQAAQKKVKLLNKSLKGAILKSRFAIFTVFVVLYVLYTASTDIKILCVFRGYFELTAALNRQLDVSFWLTKYLFLLKRLKRKTRMLESHSSQEKQEMYYSSMIHF
jgi:hypothetical protein